MAHNILGQGLLPCIYNSGEELLLVDQLYFCKLITPLILELGLKIENPSVVLWTYFYGTVSYFLWSDAVYLDLSLYME